MKKLLDIGIDPFKRKVREAINLFLADEVMFVTKEADIEIKIEGSPFEGDVLIRGVVAIKMSAEDFHKTLEQAI